jgi:hypothetical protein
MKLVVEKRQRRQALFWWTVSPCAHASRIRNAVKLAADAMLQSLIQRMPTLSSIEHMEGNSSAVLALSPRAPRVFGENLGRCDRRSEGGRLTIVI